MKRKFIKGLSALMTVAMVSVLLISCQRNEPSETTGDTPGQTTTEKPDGTEPGESTDEGTEPSTDKPTETVTLKFGTHWLPGLDPNYQDEITGEYTMQPDARNAYLHALEVIKEELNVEFEFVQYSSDVREIILQSVMAGDPVADIVNLWGGSQGTILSQNVLQPLDDYIAIYDDPEYAWQLTDQIFDGVYFLNLGMSFRPAWPLVYNVTLIEQVDALKENGVTVYPTDLFERGEWTWSKFEDYLSKIDAHFADSSAPIRPERRVEAYTTDWRFTARQAIYTAGASTYGRDGIGVASDKFKMTIDWVESLFDRELMTSEVYDNSVVPLWTDFAVNMGNSETVFTDAPGWRLGEIASNLAERDESLGIVPFPREDSLAADSPEYRVVGSLADTLAIPKGVSEERSQLAVNAVARYFNEYYKALGGVDTIEEYRSETVTQIAANEGFDILHETNGMGILSSYQYLATHYATNEFSETVGIASDGYGWDMLLNHVMMDADGYSSYGTAVDEWIGRFEDTVAQIGDALKQEEIVDNIQPNISTLEDTPFAFELGTDLAAVDWTAYLEAEDGVDGVLNIADATFDFSAIDVETVGQYGDGLVVKISDAAGNERESKYTVSIYNPENTEAPTLTIKEEYREVALDEDTSAINWKDDFVESATDADGLDIKKNVTADLSTLDTTTAGEYDVDLSVTDFAGNVTTVTVTVTVAVPEE